MRELFQPSTLLPALRSAALTTLLGLPRLWLWDDRPNHLSTLAIALTFTSFALWSFVFAWCPAPCRPVFRFTTRPGPWLVAVLGGLTCSILLALFFDPHLRKLTPEFYSTSLINWLADGLFTLAMAQLFLCLAPFSLFYRLIRSTPHAAIATVFFNLFLLGLQLERYPDLGLPFLLALLAVRTTLSSVAVGLFLHGGTFPLWCWVVVLQARELPQLLSAP